MGRPLATIKHKTITAPTGFVVSNVEYRRYKEELYGITDIKAVEVFFVTKGSKRAKNLTMKKKGAA